MNSPIAIAPDVAAEIAGWLGFLGAEKRMSAKTLDAYRRDVHQFLGFLAGHLGGTPALKQLAKLTPADVRKILEESATDLGPRGKDAQFGWGLANPQRALELVAERMKSSEQTPAKR